MAFFVFTGRGCSLNQNARLVLRLRGCHSAVNFSMPIVSPLQGGGKLVLSVQAFGADVFGNLSRQQGIAGRQ